ncbi:hypothetical protein [Desertibacillus haloalkaliphilus]|uniref:hypothetical protein n=1 Tax=Desertibacillus haloalkaliphilus TaxID=1328930 RepID=UPI001C25BD52|nr:hypothetical protein [Desertibacillus haloalkaliphilus]MBU8905181.1 hypothetical protein [Desertibacillus haloalkaliphilus]
MDYEFILDERLGISIPHLYKQWSQYSLETQADILLRWESIRGSIPDKVEELEAEINRKQAQLNVEENFQVSCQLNLEIAELASIINDLWIWYRIDQDVSATPVHQ